MNTQILDKLKPFLVGRGYLLPYEEISRWKDLYKDLGVYGDEAYDFVIAYSKEFNVDVSNFMIEEYFEPEGSRFGIISMARNLIFPRKRPWPNYIRKSFTISDLEKGIIAGRLDEEVIKSTNPLQEADFLREIDRLPEAIRRKGVRSGNEFGWKEEDFIEAVETAKKLPMAVLGGQIRYALPDTTCEFYWLSYDPIPRKKNEDWVTYCNRTADEYIRKFKELTPKTSIKKEIEEWPVLIEKAKAGVEVGKYRLFMLVFDDQESDKFNK